MQTKVIMQTKVFKNFRARQNFLLLLPVIICVGIFSFFPIMRGVYLGFTNYQIGLPIQFNGLQNYFQIYTNGFLRVAIRNSLTLVAISMFFTYVISMTLALLLNGPILFRGMWRTLLIIPWAVPPVARIAIWERILSSNAGYLNLFLRTLRITDRDYGWLALNETALNSIAAMIVWGCIPFLTICLLAALQSIPTEIYEAAKIDGAGAPTSFFHITMPYLREVTMVTTSLLFMWIINDFPSQYLLTRGGPGSATVTFATESYVQGFAFGNFGIAASYGNVLIVFILIFLFFYIRAMTGKGETR